MRPKKFSFLWALLWFLLFGIGILVYVAYYLAKSDQTVYLEVDDAGKVRKSWGRHLNIWRLRADPPLRQG